MKRLVLFTFILSVVGLILLATSVQVTAADRLTTEGDSVSPAASLNLDQAASPSIQVVNLLPDGDFESGTLSGWELTPTMAISSDVVHGGVYAARSMGGKIRQSVPVTPGKTYKVTAWVYLVDVSGGSWGGPVIQVSDLPSWDTIGNTRSLQEIVPKHTWTKVGFSFIPSGNSVKLMIGEFGDHTQVDVYFDDVLVFEKPTANAGPTVTIGADRELVNAIPGEVSFTFQGDDPDGRIAFFFWDFGDGGKSNLPEPQHSYVGNGIYPARLTIFDDDGASAQQEITITVSDPHYPTLSITSPDAATLTTANPSITVQGQAIGGDGCAIERIAWSNDRDGSSGIASGTSQWSFNLDLTGLGGFNRVLINAYDAQGRVARGELIVDYQPDRKVDIQSGASGITPNAVTVEQYGKFEVSFRLQDSVASDPYFPYDPDLPAGMPSGTGITVEGVFTAPSGKTIRQPGFLYQPFERYTNTKQLLAQGEAIWKIRFSPVEIGEWTYEVHLTDGSGSRVISDPSRLHFTVTQPANSWNHGFLHVSSNDSRYFEFSDGTAFIGVGPSVAVRNSSFETDEDLARIEAGGANLSRTWMSADNIGGSSWAPWSGRIPYIGNFPGSSLTTEEAYGDGIFSLTLPQLSHTQERCAFYGFHGTKASVKPNTDYRILIRLKTVGITGDGGFTFRPGVAWPKDCDSFAADPLVIPYVQGTNDWHVVTGVWNSGSRTHLEYALITLEQVTGGRVYLDEISMREVLGDSRLGPEILPRSKFNVQRYFSQEASWNWDYALDAMAERGFYEKPVIAEKDDYAFNHISPYGYGYDRGGEMQTIGGASHLYQQFYWRYLTARYGYSRAIHSWEYVNEDPPGRMAMANEMAKYFHAIDPQRHMASTSFWCCISNSGSYFWQDPRYPDLDYADGHAYAPSTSWLGDTDPYTDASLVDDSALYVYGHSMDVITKDAAGDRPFIMGECGINRNGVTAGSDDSDTQGVWLHQFLWSQVNPGGMYFIYWYDQTIVENNLYPLFQTYRRFMEGNSSDSVNTRIPLSNGYYQNIELDVPSRLNGWGQKDPVNGGAHFWMYDRNYTWANPSGGSDVSGVTVSFDGLPSKAYTIEWWNTWAGQVVSETRSHPGGEMSLSVPTSLHGKDVGVKIYPQEGYPGPVPPVDPTFVDVPFAHWAHDYIEALYREGYTAGCSTEPLMYCPDHSMIRAESAVFVERGIHGTDFEPGLPQTPSFTDVPAGYWGAGWIESLWVDGYTAGCGTDPLIYCPLAEHTRAEGCVFYLRMLNGSDYQPPLAQGVFVDVPTDWWGAGWVEAAYQVGLIDACQTEPELRFCPNDPLSRALAAYMMVQAKGLSIP